MVPLMCLPSKKSRSTPDDNEVLVNVHAASINSWDWDMVRGEPFVVRFWGLFKPRHTIPGADIAGTVEAVGRLVKTFKPGDEVFGDLCECGWGGFAEFACARENALALKPAGMTFEQAAAIPQAGLMALQSFRDKGQVKPCLPENRHGQKVLINGAGGGVGTFAVQMAKAIQAEVTVVDHASKLEQLRALGADHVIDYRKEDFTKNGKAYDLIIDVVANRSLAQYKRSLRPEGIFFMIGGTMPTLFLAMFLGPLLSGSDGKKLGILAYQPNKGLDFMTELFTAGKVIPVIDRTFTLSETPDAFRYYAEGKFIGKIVISI